MLRNTFPVHKILLPRIELSKDKNVVIIWFNCDFIYSSTRYMFKIDLDITGVNEEFISTSTSSYEIYTQDVSNGYSCIDCKKEGLAKFNIDILQNIEEHKVGIKITLLNNLSNTGKFYYIRYCNNYNSYISDLIRTSSLIFERYEFSKNEDISQLSITTTRDILTIIFTKSPSSNQWISTDNSKTFILIDKCSNYPNQKSIKIPKWLNNISITATTVEIADNYMNYQVYSYIGKLSDLKHDIRLITRYDAVSMIESDYDDIKLSTEYRNSEDKLIYDGEDNFYQYYHIQHHKTNLYFINNSIRIIGTVKSNIMDY